MEAKLSYEFYKLDAIDRKVACWLYAECPKQFYDYLQFIATKNYECKGIKLNVNKTLDEFYSLQFDSGSYLELFVKGHGERKI